MRTLLVLLLSLLTALLLGCSTTPDAPLAAVECDEPRDDQCVTMLCLGDACGFYRCAPSPAEIYKHAGELIHRFELIGGPIQPYYSRPGA